MHPAGSCNCITVVSTAYVQPPLPFKRSPNDRVPFLLEGVCTASKLYEDLIYGRTTWSEVREKHSDLLLPSQQENCYASSKNILEHLMFERYSKLPIAIVRPSIVSPSRDGKYGYDVRSGLSLFINVAKHHVMLVPCSQGRLNMVFVEDVASDIIRAAQDIDNYREASAVGHPIICSTSRNEVSPIEFFRKVAPEVNRVNVDNQLLRTFLRMVEFAVTWLFSGRKKAKLVSRMYKNYDLIMSQEFDFPEKHGPVADDAARGILLHYERQAEKEKLLVVAHKTQAFHFISFLVGVLLLATATASASPSKILQIFVFITTAIVGVIYLPDLSVSPRFFRHFTQGFDYIWVAISIVLFNRTITLCLPDEIKIPFIAAGCQAMSVIRDVMYMTMFPRLIANEKMSYRYSVTDLLNTIQTCMSASLLLIILRLSGFMNMTTMSSWRSLGSLWLDVNVMAILNDYPVMSLLHSWMHESGWAFAKVHAKHHKSKLSCQAVHAFQFDILDLVIENGLAPPLYILVKTAVGFSPAIPLASVALLTYQQICGEHSLNPHSIFFLNPLLDSVFKVNIEHNLHHAVPGRAGTTAAVIPLSHVRKSARREAILEYERVFGVDLGFEETMK